MTDATTTAAQPAQAPAPGGLGQRLRAAFADPNPILVKEFRTIFRSKLFIRFLYLSTFGVSALVLLVGSIVAQENTAPADAGRGIFQMYFSLALAVLSIVAPAQGAMSITSEREGRTYESLLLTGMDPSRVVWGKFFATYASLMLVLVAMSPVVGIAFLFGGISPLQVLIAFAGLAIALAPAVAYGVAISAHTPSTRIALLAAVFTWPTAAMMGTGMWTILGEELKRTWGLTNEGPFWFAEALSERAFELDTLLGVAIGPTYLAGTILWFCIAAAIAGVRPAAEDRSSPLKIWAAASLVGPTVLFAALPFAVDRRESWQSAIVLLGLVGFLMVFYALLFVNEPPLPPRARTARTSALGRAMRPVFGPGALPTLRFATLLLFVTPLLFTIASSIGRRIAHPTSNRNDEADIGMLSLSVGMSVIAWALVAVGTYVRVKSRRGAASRAVVVAVFIGAMFLPLLMTAIIDPSGMNRIEDDAPLLIMLSPIMPIVSAVASVERDDMGNPIFMVPLLLVWGAFALGFHLRARKLIRDVVHQVEAARTARMGPPSSGRDSAAPPEPVRHSAPPGSPRESWPEARRSSAPPATPSTPPSADSTPDAEA